MPLKRCIICNREFENIFNRPVRDIIWSRINERLGKEYLKPFYQQICQLCRYKFGVEMIETSTEEIEKKEKNVLITENVIDRMKELSKEKNHFK